MPNDGSPLGTPGAPAAVALLARYVATEASAELTLMQLLLALGDATLVRATVEHAVQASPHDGRLRALLALTTEHRSAIERTSRLVASGLATLPAGDDDPVAAIRTRFDRAVALAPEAAVALYSLGSGAILERATAEIVARLREWHLLRPTTDVLDLGCGIGRVECALAGHVGSILGLDVSPAMIAEAERRCAGLPAVRFEVCSGRDLASVPVCSFDLVLAVDSFPYIVAAGAETVRRQFADVQRILRNGGAFLILNYSYRGDPQRDLDDVATLARDNGLVSERLGTRDLTLWDGITFLLRKRAA